MTDILALDVATTCGFARGLVGAPPIAGSIRFGDNETANHRIEGRALAWIAKLLEPEPRPHILIMEAMLPAAAKLGDTHRQVRDRLAGLHAIFRAVADLRGIPKIMQVAVGDVRAHFIGDRGCKRALAKRETIRKCQALGWPADDDNAADALAVWSYACALVDPMTALQVSPLFHRRRVA